MNMIWIQEGWPNWDSLPVFTMKNFIKGGRLSKPFFQARVCYSKQIGLCFKLFAYENIAYYKQLPGYLGNHIELFWSLKPQVGVGHKIVANIDGIENTEGETLIKTEKILGEDLQGKFWSVQIIMPNELIETEINKKLEADDVFAFNVFKYWRTNLEYNHWGQMFGNVLQSSKKPFSNDSLCKLISI